METSRAVKFQCSITPGNFTYREVPKGKPEGRVSYRTFSNDGKIVPVDREEVAQFDLMCLVYGTPLF